MVCLESGIVDSKDLKMNSMLLKLHAWVYRTFGIFTKYARKKETEYIKSLEDVSDFEKDIYIGCWHAKNGFYRTNKQVMRQLKRKVKNGKR
jgi:hypothetical protein